MRATRKGSVRERFFERFVVNVENGCWEWSGCLSGGYGVIGGEIDGKRYAPIGQAMLAHRVSWILHFGPIPESDDHHGTVVMHRCDNPKCVNPEHLCLGSQYDNVADMISKGRAPVRAVKYGVDHHRSAIKNQADIDLICATQGKTKELAGKYGVTVSAIKRIRARNGLGAPEKEKYGHRQLSQEDIDHIRSTPPGTRGLTARYGMSKTAISNIRKGLTYK